MEDLDAHDAFGKLASEARVDILRAVAAANREADADGTRAVRFAELRRRAGLADPGRFNYHLGELAGTFLRKTGDGYAFTYAGERVVRTILSDAYNREVSLDPVSVDGTCPSCGAAALALRAERVELRVRCADCGQVVARTPVVPGVVADRESDEVAAAVAERLRAAMRSTVAGDCQDCGGVLDGDVEAAASVPGGRLYVATCEECWAPYRLPVALWVFDHPATVAFYWERGVDVRDLPFWELLGFVDDGRWRVDEPEGGPAYVVTVREDDRRLRFDLDDRLDVLDVRRERTDGP